MTYRSQSQIDFLRRFFSVLDLCKSVEELSCELVDSSLRLDRSVAVEEVNSVDSVQDSHSLLDFSFGSKLLNRV